MKNHQLSGENDISKGGINYAYSGNIERKSESEVPQSCPTVAYQAPPSMGFSRQEYWSGLPFLSPEDLPDPGTGPESPALQAVLY